jgi:hypothetical protein
MASLAVASSEVDMLISRGKAFAQGVWPTRSKRSVKTRMRAGNLLDSPAELWKRYEPVNW